jgi:CRISPR/Cas system-associated endonuclease/helicase Cas3
MKNELRNYQVEAISQLRQAIAKGNRCVVLQLATGGGKTTIASEMIRRANEKGKKCLVERGSISLPMSPAEITDSMVTCPSRSLV